MSRDHRRPKTDRLDTQMLMRAFLGWLRGEPGHCRMAAIPTLEQEDAKRPTRERETLVAERTRIINRTKSALIRLGIRGFNPSLRKARERLASLRTPEGVPIPPNTLACGFRRCRPAIPRSCRSLFRHDVARLRRPAGALFLSDKQAAGQSFADGLGRVRRRLSPARSMRWALWTRRSRMASA